MLFYFSATGNTRQVALWIAERLGERAVDIETISGAYSYRLDKDERLGFAFPVYFGTVPSIVADFLGRLHVEVESGYYGYIITTSGPAPANAVGQMRRLMLKHGLTLNAAFSVKTIDTFLPFFTLPDGAERARLESETEVQAKFAAEQIADRTRTSLRKDIFERMTTRFESPIYYVARKTRAFCVSDACTGCGLCASHCPSHAIELSDETHKPKWVRAECMLCLRCLHHCPHEAIDYGRWTRGKSRYREAWGSVSKTET